MSYSEDVALVDELNSIQEGLTDWELGFVQSVSDWVMGEGRKMNATQRAKAEEILEQVEERNA